MNVGFGLQLSDILATRRVAVVISWGGGFNGHSQETGYDDDDDARVTCGVVLVDGRGNNLQFYIAWFELRSLTLTLLTTPRSLSFSAMTEITNLKV